jgi:hypothetical protein
MPILGVKAYAYGPRRARATLRTIIGQPNGEQS